MCIFFKNDIFKSVKDVLTYGQKFLDYEKILNSHFFIVKKLLTYGQKVIDTPKSVTFRKMHKKFIGPIYSCSFETRLGSTTDNKFYLLKRECV